MNIVAINGMKAVVDAADQLGSTKGIGTYTWQRENMIPVANQALSRAFDGILFVDPNDDTTDEVLIDNTGSVLTLEDLYIFHKDRRDPTREAQVLARGPAA